MSAPPHPTGRQHSTQHYFISPWSRQRRSGSEGLVRPCSAPGGAAAAGPSSPPSGPAPPPLSSGPTGAWLYKNCAWAHSVLQQRLPDRSMVVGHHAALLSGRE